MTLGSFLKKSRIEAGLTQGEVARAFNLKSCQFISNLERSVSDLPKSMISDIAKLYGIEPEKVIRLMVKSYEKELLDIVA